MAIDFRPAKSSSPSCLRVVGRHPRTTFIGAHFGNNADDLAAVGKRRWTTTRTCTSILTPGFRNSGRAPYSARKFFIKYQDRILFGTDTTPRRDAFRIYYRFLETDDEYFDCAASHHLQGFWRIYGIFLPDDVLEKIYVKNAERVLLAQTPPAKAAQAEAAKASAPDRAGQAIAPELKVARIDDFNISGDGGAAAWSKVDWTPLVRRGKAGRRTHRLRCCVLRKWVVRAQMIQRTTGFARTCRKRF